MICNNDSSLVKKTQKNICTKWNYKERKVVDKKLFTFENLTCLLIPRKYVERHKNYLVLYNS